MATLTARQGRSTWVNSARPGLEYKQVAKPSIKDTTRYAYLALNIGSALRPGATIHSATLQIPVGAAGNFGDVTVRRAAAAWATRTINWNNRPGVTGTGTTVTVGSVGASYVMQFDVASDLQTWLNGGGGAHPGWRVATTSTTARTIQGIPGAVLVVEYSYTPAVPTGLVPGGGRSVSVSKPWLQWTSGEIVAHQVQVAPVGTTWSASAGFTGATYDSGTVSSAAKEHDLPGSAFAGVATGSDASWTVRVANSGGQWSPWASPAAWERTAKPTPTLVSPSGGVVTDNQPLLDVDVTGITKHRWMVARASAPSTLIYDSGELPTIDGQHVPSRPTFTQLDTLYVVTARAWDDVVREATPGDPPYVQVSATVELDYTDVLDGPALSIGQVGPTPVVKVSWTDSPAAEAYTVQRSDRDQPLGRFDAADVAYGSGYRIFDYSCPPNVAVTYTVRPHADAETGVGVSVVHTTRVGTRFLIDPESGEFVAILGQEQDPFTAPEVSMVHAPESSEFVIRRRLGRRKAEGSITGTLIDSFYGEAAGFVALLERWADPEQTPADKVFRYVVGDENRSVWLGDINLPPSSLTEPGQLVKGVSLNWWSAPEPD